MKNYIYFHICCINNWIQTFEMLLSEVKRSGLYDKIDKIKCVLLTPTGVPDELFRDKKIELLGVFSDLKLYEQVTLHLLHEDAKNEENDFNVLYFHSKGVKHNNQNPCIQDWVDLLTYFNIVKHEDCIKGLTEHDAVGINLTENPVLHYSGNFWWSKASHLRTLEKCTYESYNSPEFWVTSRPGKYLNLWTSVVNHYKERYPSSLYIL